MKTNENNRKIAFHHSDAQKPKTFKTQIAVLELMSTQPVMVDGVQLSESKFIVDDPSERFKGVRYTDFALENQLAAGVNLRSATCVPTSFAMIDDVATNTIRLFEDIKTKNA